MRRPRESANRRWERAVAALLTEPTVEAAAAAVGVSPATLYRWLGDPAFASLYRASRRRALEAAVGQLQRASGQAVQALVDALSSRKVGDRIRAAALILDRAAAGVELL